MCTGLATLPPQVHGGLGSLPAHREEGLYKLMSARNEKCDMGFCYHTNVGISIGSKCATWWHSQESPQGWPAVTRFPGIHARGIVY